MSGMRRRHKCTWTLDEDVTLRREWGRLSERVLRELLGRTARALCARALTLRLGPQAQGVASVRNAADHLGVATSQVRSLAREFGVRLDARAPVRQRPGIAATVHRGVDLDQFEDLFAQRERRTTTQQVWCLRRGVNHNAAGLLFARHDVPSGAERRRRHRFPVAVIDELAAGGPGPWCRAWAAALAIPRSERAAAPWLLCLVAMDLHARPAAQPHGDRPDDREDLDWIDASVPQGAQKQARELVQRLWGTSPALRRAA